MSQHLWEVRHPYYCNLGNYFDNDCGSSFKSFADFMDDSGDADMDYNLVFRWDWVEENAETGEPNYNGDDNYRNGELRIFWMGQRKGLYRFSTVEVCRADEAAVIAFLRPRMEYLLSLWQPLAALSQPATQQGEER